MSGGATRRLLADGRWHFQHGPIDCIVDADGDAGAVARCVERAWTRFQGVLDELVAELPLLRADLSGEGAERVTPSGGIARRMVAACRPYGEAGAFVTAMAAVAGSVAEELTAFFDDAGVARASVNNGGDIALHLAPASSYAVGLCSDPSLAVAGGPLAGRFEVGFASPVRGIATSGWRGRSFSFGIADSVTVLAGTASAADAAATMIGNAVDVDAAGIRRRPASELRDDSDLGERLVTVAVPPLRSADVERALAAGAAVAEREIAAGRVVAAAISLQGRFRVVDRAPSGRSRTAAWPRDPSQPRFLRRDSQPTTPSPISISA
ncbi:MAG TPA: UPF0280 family protein [Caldimonas sp.]|nr:UPF0280 family protein [Caldimonas sp.]HEX2542374.1 UPF0280 family protein [Caldimonas sp.]